MNKKIKTWKTKVMLLSKMNPAPYNPKIHTDEFLDRLEVAMTEYGVVQYLVWNKRTGNLVDGHGKHKILVRNGIKKEETIIVDLSPEKEKALNVTLTALRGDWDVPKLTDLLDEIQVAIDSPDMDLCIDMEDLGLSEGLLEELLGYGEDEPETEEDDWMPPPAPTNDRDIKRGDIYTLGNHRLLCGDSTSPEDVSALMAGKKSRIVWTDPPWNVAIGKDSNPKRRQREGLVNDDLDPKVFKKLILDFAKQTVPHNTGDFYCVLGASEWPTLDAVLRSVGYHWSATIIWVKDIFVLGRSNYHRRYEPLWYGWHDKNKSSYNGKRDLDDVWEIDRPKRSEEHPTMKPIELVAKSILNSTVEGDIVWDPFGGSGTALVTCEQLKRICFMHEISPHYCNVIIDRWEAFTSQTAEKLT